MEQLPSLDLFKLLRAPDAAEAVVAASRLEARSSETIQQAIRRL